MNFVQFAEAHGLILKGIEGDGRWHRVPTTDKPHKRNGAYRFLGDVGIVINHRTMTDAAVWSPSNKEERVSGDEIQAVLKRLAKEQEEKRANASRRAQEAVKHCKLARHPYLAKKGFPDEVGLVNDSNELVIPMRRYADYRALDGVQRIAAPGCLIKLANGDEVDKAFLGGSSPKGLVFIIGKSSRNRERWFCEGYATGLSIKAALDSMYRPGEVVVCFTAGNLKHVAKDQPGYVFADNDHPNLESPARGETGQKAAQAIGSPWVMSPIVGEDANDYMKRMGVPALAKLMREVYG